MAGKLSLGLIFALVFCFAESEALAKPMTPDYASIPAVSQSVSGLEAGAAASEFAAKQLVEEMAKREAPIIAEAATTTAVFDGTSDAAKALNYGRYAGTVTRGAFAAKKYYDLSKLYYGLGGAVADIQELGLKNGSIAASEQLSKIDVAKPLVTVGKHLGETAAKGVTSLKECLKRAEGQGGSKPSLQKKQADMNSPDHDNTSGDWDCCKCENPDDCDFRCKKCGKMSKWLAPEPDLEFLQWLKK